MSASRALLGRELRRLVRTQRVLVTCVLFVLIGLGSPLLAKLTPMLLRSIPPEQLGGMELLLTAEPTQADALGQYVKNFGLLPILVVVSGMGAIAGPWRSGALALLLSRPVSRQAYAATVFAGGAGLYLLATALSAAGCAAYTRALFGGIDALGFLALNALLWLHLALLHAATTWGSSLGRGAGAAAAAGIGAWIGLGALSALPVVGRFTPGAVLDVAGRLVMSKTIEPAAAASSVVGVVALIAVLVLAAARRLERAELG